MSIVSVFALLMFTMLLLMIVNVATHLDDKVKMQNAADAAAHSGAVVLARGMNAIAFTNHLEADVFAITAFLREARDRNAESLTPQVLDEWERVAGTFEQATFEKFAELGRALREKVPLERRLVAAFGNLSEAAAAYALPVFESILAEQHIPEFQRNLVRTLPALAQQTTREIASRHALSRKALAQLEPGGAAATPSDRPQLGVLWRMDGIPVGLPMEEDPRLRTLPAVDPDPAQSDFQIVEDPQAYLELALTQRRELAKHYLEAWNSDKLRIFDRDAELSQFGHLWRIFTCANLEHLLSVEYPLTNLPMVLRLTEFGADAETLRQQGRQADVNAYLERDFQFLAVVYGRHLRDYGPRVFRNPLPQLSDALTFAEVALFLPQPRSYRVGPRVPDPDVGLGGTFGFDSGLTLPVEPPPAPVAPEEERWALENWPWHWDLLNQNWMVQLVPATARNVPSVLQTPPPVQWGEYRPPRFDGMTIQDFKRINTH